MHETGTRVVGGGSPSGNGLTMFPFGSTANLSGNVANFLNASMRVAPMNPPNDASLPHIIVVGAGFAGLNFVRRFPERLARITIIDRQNHHLFQPLLYQVATAGLSAVDIAQPVRGVFGARPNLEVLMSEVRGVDLAQKRVRHERGELVYDYLVLAAGAKTSYFGHDDWEKFAPGLKSLDDALRVRRLILCSLERAETEPDPDKCRAAMTIVVVGGGPTGVELAGAFAELTRTVLEKDFDHIDPTKVRVILVQGGPRVLPTFSEELSASAQRQLEKLGVEVRTGARVDSIGDGEVTVAGEKIRADNIIWAAGVSAAPLAKKLGLPVDRAGRIAVLPDLSVPDHPDVFALGDMVTLADVNGVEVPGVAQGAIQMGRHAAEVIERELRREKLSPAGRKPFAYYDKGSMATIGRSAAVAEIKKLKLSGFPAWVVWLAVHLMFLVGFRNKFSVLMQWVYSYLTFKRGARIITGVSGEKSAGSA
jgi:NADH:ubiquinone reductase (H+-translocating)